MNTKDLVPGAAGDAQWRRCPYCQGSLDPRYYFCVHCAAVYRQPEPEVYEEEPEPPPTLERRLVEEGRAGWNYFCILVVGMVCIGTLAGIGGEDMIGIAVLVMDVFMLTVTTTYLVFEWRQISYLFRGVTVNAAFILSLPLLAAALGLNKLYHETLISLLDIENGGGLIEILGKALSPGVLFLVICVFPAIFEEIGFRGIIQQRLVGAAGVKIGFILTSVLFAAVHFTVLSAPYLFLLSLLLCWVRHATRSIYPAMGLHFLHNFVVLVYFEGM